jgi:16S rRNA (cytidine1402-2'-O)-methyltransferase
MPGTLFLVATPIGHLEDITVRALRVLREVSVVAAEDTRRTAGLLAHYGIRTPLVSFHAHNERARTAELLARLRQGESIALVSDAGTPLVSDPGHALVRAAREAGIRVEAVPGPSAILAALVSSGLAADTFTFLGFPPAGRRQRDRWLAALAAEPRPVVFFEAPHRLQATLTAAAAVLGNRPIAIARELTKVHEEVLVGTAAELAARLREPRGEFTVVVGAPPIEPAGAAGPLDEAALWRSFCDLTDRERLTRREAVAALARRHGRPAREIYAALERARAAAEAAPR